MARSACEGFSVDQLHAIVMLSFGCAAKCSTLCPASLPKAYIKKEQEDGEQFLLGHICVSFRTVTCSACLLQPFKTPSKAGICRGTRGTPEHCTEGFFFFLSVTLFFNCV